jgi:ribosome-associated protein
MFPAGKPHESASEPSAPPSKSRRKREMHDLQQLGEVLCALDPGRLAALNLPERLVDAITLARTITRHEGRRRQLQYVGRLMRDIDPQPLRAALTEWEKGPERERARFATLERWRTRVLNEQEGVDDFIAAYPRADRAALTALVADAQKERAQGGRPHKHRALFRALKRAVDESGG